MPAVRFEEKGDYSLCLDDVERVGIRDIADLVSYRIFKDGSFIIHEIGFKDGGKGRFSYRDGELAELNFERVKVGGGENELILRRYGER